MADEGSDDRSAAAGVGTGRWLESSWDLSRGLTVEEGLPADAGLDEWLEAMLRDDGAGPPDGFVLSVAG